MRGIGLGAAALALLLAAGPGMAEQGKGHSHQHGHDHSQGDPQQARIAKGYFEDAQVADRPLSDWEGDWQSVYPLLLDGTLDPVMAHKAELATRPPPNTRPITRPAIAAMSSGSRFMATPSASMPATRS